MVDNETGNIGFDGHIKIEGAMEEGFCVKARRLSRSGGRRRY